MSVPTGPRVAVLLAAHRGEQWLPEQLASIQAQSGVQVDLYISVDHDGGGTLRWCQAYAANHANVTLLTPGQFGSAGRNFFRLLRDVAPEGYDCLAFADQDDIWYPGKLQRAVSVLAQTGAAAYSSNVLAFWSDGREQVLHKAQPQVRWDHFFEAAGPGCTYVWTANMGGALQRFVAAHWGALQGVALHDWFVYAYARQHGWRWHIDPQPNLRYRQHGLNQLGANTSLASMMSRLKKIRQGWWFGQIGRLAALCSAPAAAPLAPRMGRREVVRMVLSARQCRRRPRDRVLFVAVCLAALVMGVPQ